MSPERSQVVVIGAGLAGLSAAWRLAEAGISVTVLERERRPGGRASSESLEGFEVDPGGHRVTTADRNLLALTRTLGEAGALLPLRPLARAQVHRGELVSVNPTALFGVASLPGIPLLQALRVARLGRLLRRFRRELDPREPERAAALDDRSAAEFGRLYFGPKIVERWIEPTLAEAAAEDERETSRVAFLLRHVAEHWATPASFRSPLGRLPRALAARLAVRLSREVERIEACSGRRLAVRVREGGCARTLEAEAVVVAVPADEAVRAAEPVLTRFERDCLRGVRYGALITSTIATSRALVGVGTRVRVPRIEGGLLSSLHLEPAGAGGRAPEGRGLACLVARESWSRTHLDTPVETIAKELGSELERMFPGIAGVTLFSWVHRHPQALPRFEVGRYRALARLRRVQRQLRREGRRVYFAGDFLVAPSLEGAVTSGLRAAEEAREDLAS